MTDLTQAIAEIRRVTPLNSPWEAGDIGVGSSPVDYHIATILNAVASGELIPLADHKLAVALMVEKAADVCDPFARASETKDAILALADTDALVEVQALRDERDGLLRAVHDNHEADKRAEAAEAELAATQAKLALVVEALQSLIYHTHNCEKELTEQLHHVDFCGESLPLTEARASLEGAMSAKILEAQGKRK